MTVTSGATSTPRQDLVLVPGSGCDHRLFRHQIETLRDRATIHVLATTARPRIEDLAADALAALPDRFALAGLSMGGLVALEMIRQAPERITGLALLDTLPGPGRRSDAVNHRLAIGILALRLFGPVEALMWPRYVHPARLHDTGLRTLVQEMMLATGARGLINQQRLFISRPDYRPVLPGITVPTLVLVGEADTLSPPAAARGAARAIPRATLVTVPDAGHLTTLERPSAVSDALLHWLLSLQPGATVTG